MNRLEKIQVVTLDIEALVIFIIAIVGIAWLVME